MNVEIQPATPPSLIDRCAELISLNWEQYAETVCHNPRYFQVYFDKWVKTLQLNQTNPIISVLLDFIFGRPIVTNMDVERIDTNLCFYNLGSEDREVLNLACVKLRLLDEPWLAHYNRHISKRMFWTGDVSKVRCDDCDEDDTFYGCQSCGKWICDDCSSHCTGCCAPKYYGDQEFDTWDLVSLFLCDHCMKKHILVPLFD
jgi:hypothetical protein